MLKKNTTMISYDYEYRNEYGQKVLQTTETDPLGHLTVTTMDALGRTVSAVKKNTFGIIISERKFQYDVAGNRVKAIESVIIAGRKEREAVVAWKYNASNEVAEVVEAVGTPDEKHTCFLYNHFGQKEATVKPDGVLLLNEYDAKGRLSLFKASDGSFEYAYAYDCNDHGFSCKKSPLII